MSFDMNDAEPQKTSELIPDGGFAKVVMTIRRGGIDGDSEIDRGLLKASNAPGSDVRMLDCEFTVAEGPFARRKFWQNFTVSGGKVDDQGASIGWKISKSTFRAMIDSALGLDPKDMSDTAKGKRVLRGLADLSGISFIAKVRVESSDNPRYGDSNKLDRVVLPGEPEWRKVMDGETVPPSPNPRSRSKPATSTAATPAWGQQAAVTTPVAAAPAWNSPTTVAQAPGPTPVQPTATPAPTPTPAKPSSGPAWLSS